MIPANRARKTPVLIGVLVISVALGLLSTLAESIGIVLLAGAGGMVLLALILGVWSLPGLANALAFSAGLTVSLIALRAGAEVTVADTLLGGAFATVLVMSVRRRVDRGPLRRHLWVLGLISLVVFGGLAGSFVAGDLSLSLAELARFAASSMVVVMLFWLWAPDRLILTRLCWAILAGATLNAVLGLFMEKYGNRAVGLADHPNHLAMACALSVGTTMALLLLAKGSLQRLALAVCLGALGVGVIASGSRAGILAMAVAIGTFLILTRRWKLVGVGLVSVGLVAMGLYFNVFAMGELNAANRLRGDQSSIASDRERLELAQGTIEDIADHPITGSGFEAAKAAHSIYLQLWVSAGIFGLIFAAGLAAVTCRILLEARRRSDLLTIGLASSYLGYLAAGVVSNILWDRYLWLHLGVLLALAGSWNPPDVADSATRHRTPGAVTRLAGKI